VAGGRQRDVQALVDRMVANGIDAPTVVKTIDPLRAIYRYAVRHDELTVNPTVNLDVPRSRRRRERVASVDEAAALLRSVPEGDRALWATAFYGGLRRGELRALRCDACDFATNRVRVSRTWDDQEGELDDGKSDNAKREVWMVPELRRELIEHKLRTGCGGDDLIFGRSAGEPFIPSSVRRRALAHCDGVGGPRLVRLTAPRRNRSPCVCRLARGRAGLRSTGRGPVRPPRRALSPPGQ
jgi:integrase